jgi:hypothetical protein
MKRTRAYKVENFDAVERRAWVSELALSAVLQDDCLWSPWVTEKSITGENERGKYRVGHAAAWRSDGGYWISQFRCEGQRDQISVEYWETQHAVIFSDGYVSTFAKIMRECVSRMNRTVAA